MRALRRTGDVVLTLAAVLGVLGLALFVAVRLGAAQPLVVTSGSMRPTLEVGDLVVARSVPASTLEVGDVATLRSDGGRLITHRVVAVSVPAADGTVEVEMRGDANDTADPLPYTVERALVPMVTVPRVGPVVAAVQRPTVAIPGLVAVAALVAIAFVPTSRRAEDGSGDGSAAEASPARTGRHAAR